jgi:hypothetical protein
MTLPEFACTCVPDSPPCLGCRANAVIAAAYVAGVRDGTEVERERCSGIIAGLARQLNEASRRYGAEKDYERAFDAGRKALAMVEAMIAVAEPKE